MLYWKSFSFCIRFFRFFILFVIFWFKFCYFFDIICIVFFVIFLFCLIRLVSDFFLFCNFFSWGVCLVIFDFKFYSEKILVYLYLVIYRFIDIKKNNDIVDYLFYSRILFYVLLYFVLNCKIIKFWMFNFDNNFF